MQDRKISVAEVEQILTSPDGKIRQSRDKAIFYRHLSRRKDNLIAAVVIEKLPDDWIEVLTVLVNFEVRK